MISVGKKSKKYNEAKYVNTHFFPIAVLGRTLWNTHTRAHTHTHTHTNIYTL